MRPLWLVIFIAAVVAAPPDLWSQQRSTHSSLMLRGTIVTSTRVFDNPDAPTALDRDHFDFVDNLLGGGLAYFLEFPEQGFTLSLSVEYASRVTEANQLILINNVARQFPVEQGVRFIPIELGVEAGVPLIRESLMLTMGGGFGAYYADRVFGISGVQMKSKTLPVGFGIHIESGFDYRISQNFRVGWEMRFRDPEIINESEFGSDFIKVDNFQVPVSNVPPKTKINVHGVSFTVGIIYDLGW